MHGQDHPPFPGTATAPLAPKIAIPRRWPSILMTTFEGGHALAIFEGSHLSPKMAIHF
jgi:hypothetical protein